ncbi:MAG TPA: hypothetical protein VFR47_05720 [Anaerolineales bacterium]|nr:hypothetical protein [Anaerolineales bacterium]
MANEPTPYIVRNPGDLIAAEDWNEMQVMIKEDIAAQVGKAIDEIESVPFAEDAGKLSGQTTEELTNDIIEKALAQIPSRSGYQRLFKVLKVGEENVVEHGLHEIPLVDVYQLDYFNVICSEDEEKYESWVTFYLYHTSEKKLRLKPATGSTRTSDTIEIEPADSHVYRIPFADMLHRYQVSYTDSSSLDDLETDFWEKFFAEPNDSFDDDQYCHSPWFDRCCREKTSVSNLKRKGDWDDIWFQMRARKTINWPYEVNSDGNLGVPAQKAFMPAPTQIQVAHFDFDTLGITLLTAPIYPDGLKDEIGRLQTGRDISNELKVMLLLKA